MSLFQINSNLTAMDAQYYLGLNQQTYAQAVQQLSSGLRINSAADDAAGYAIAQGLQAQVNGLNQASLNAQQGISMVQTAQGALNNIQNMLQRMNTLATEGSNGTLSSTDTTGINDELQQLLQQINLISSQTKYNGLGLLDGSLSTTVDAATSGVQNGFSVVAGTNTSVTNLDVSQANANDTYTFANNNGVLTLTDGNTGVSQSIDLTNASVAAGGNYDLNFNQLGVNLTISSVAGETGANVAAGFDGKTITTNAGNGSATLQIGASASDTMNIGFNEVDISANGLSALNTALGNYNSTQSTANAQALMTAVQNAINTVDTTQSTLGAYQNRLTDTINNLGQNSQNLATSQSQIQNVDMASAMVTYSKTSILLQAGTAILAQANQAPNMVLKLLQ